MKKPLLAGLRPARRGYDWVGCRSTSEGRRPANRGHGPQGRVNFGVKRWELAPSVIWVLDNLAIIKLCLVKVTAQERAASKQAVAV